MSLPVNVQWKLMNKFEKVTALIGAIGYISIVLFIVYLMISFFIKCSK